MDIIYHNTLLLLLKTILVVAFAKLNKLFRRPGERGAAWMPC